MAKKNGAQSVETIPGRKIVLSAGVGKTNVDELNGLQKQFSQKLLHGNNPAGHILQTAHR